MNNEVELLHATWDSIKAYIPKKERLHVAETLVRTFDDTAGLSDIDEYLNEFDSTMKSALVSHFDLFDDEDDEDDDWD